MARSLLVTGAAGFIGANFAHYWMRQHPGDRLVVYDALTYAGNRASLEALRDLNAGQVQAAGKTAGASAKKAAEVIVAP